MRSGRPGRPRQDGFTLLALLAGMVVLALATQAVMFNLSQQAQREREEELLRIGRAYVTAIRDYYEQSPGVVKRWPPTLADLQDDRRFVGMRRHMREAYADPVARSTDWGLVRGEDGGIQGVYSLSERATIRTTAIDLGVVTVGPAERYADWRFVYQPPPAAPRR